MAPNAKRYYLRIACYQKNKLCSAHMKVSLCVLYKCKFEFLLNLGFLSLHSRNDGQTPSACPPCISLLLSLSHDGKALALGLP
jgi:hypothetical protein